MLTLFQRLSHLTDPGFEFQVSNTKASSWIAWLRSFA